MEQQTEQYVLNPEMEVIDAGYREPNEKEEEMSSVSTVTDPNQGMNELLARVQRQKRSGSSSSSSSRPGVSFVTPKSSAPPVIIGSVDNVLRSTKRTIYPAREEREIREDREASFREVAAQVRDIQASQKRLRDSSFPFNFNFEVLGIGALIFFTSYGMYKCGMDVYTLFADLFSKSAPVLPPVVV